MQVPTIMPASGVRPDRHGREQPRRDPRRRAEAASGPVTPDSPEERHHPPLLGGAKLLAGVTVEGEDTEPPARRFQPGPIGRLTRPGKPAALLRGGRTDRRA